uniref:MTP_lip_bd domain-containing protein n=1 Tax=Mesocestoides corti TaxID=53468 RepID=A0A5K3F221_MESCO
MKMHLILYTGLAALALLSFHCCQGENAPPRDIHVYSYISTVTAPDQKEFAQSVKGHVLVSLRGMAPRRKPSGAVGPAQQLLVQILLSLETSPGPFAGLLLLDSHGLAERLLLPPSTNSSDTRVNFLKAVASVFSYHKTFEPGVEYDASGRCGTFYGEVANPDVGSLDPRKILVVDKQKLQCEPIGQPIDAGVWSVSPILRDKRVTHSWMRYYIRRDTGLLQKAMTFEEHKITFALDGDVSGRSELSVSGEQMLELLDDESKERKTVLAKLSGLMKTSTSTQLSSIASDILGKGFQVEHLALEVPRQLGSSGCGIQSVAFEAETLNSPNVALSLSLLQEKLRGFEKVIDQPARISSAHASLQLIRFLRCLPSDLITVQTVSTALGFIPTSNKDLHRQVESGWHNQLTDIVVNCGTELCLELLRQRLVKVTELAAFSKLGTAAPREVRPARTYLLSQLWPALAHISNPSLKMFRELFALCYHSLPAMEKVFLANELESDSPYTCLLTISTIASRFRGRYNEERLLFSKVAEILASFITLDDKEYVDNQFTRTKLLAAFTAAEQVKAASLSEPLLSLVQNSKIPSVLRAAGLKALGNLAFSDDTTAIATIVTKLYDIIDSPARGPLFARSEDELIVKFGAFSVLLNIEAPAPQLARILSRFGSKRQWSLVASCRRLVDSWCAEELLPEETCQCIRRGGLLRTGSKKQPQVCSPGLAAGWSGLAGTKAAGEINLISGDLVDHRPTFLSDYSLQWVCGPHGEFRSSNLAINLIGAESEAKLMSFNFYADQLATLMGKDDTSASPWLSVGFSLLRGTIPPRQIFSGSLTEIWSILTTTPNQPTPFFLTLRLPVDVRRYIPLSSGWVLRNDMLGVTSMELSGALKSSVWSQSGSSLIRTRAAVAIENLVTLVPSRNNDNTNLPVVTLVNGMGSAARLDFVIQLEMGGLPDSICMLFRREKTTPILRWTGEHVDAPVLRQRENLLRPLPKPEEGSNKHYVLTQSLRLPPASYFLGAANAARCRTMEISDGWN